tara:strand:+ start:1156 stop:1344 length:189 start_codon:yes stop_codon:yes gene_type:complete
MTKANSAKKSETIFFLTLIKNTEYVTHILKIITDCSIDYLRNISKKLNVNEENVKEENVKEN